MKRCRFCGRLPDKWERDDPGKKPRYWVRCRNDACDNITPEYGSEREAVEKWNEMNDEATDETEEFFERMEEAQGRI